MTRPSWDDYFLAIAIIVSTRATCPRSSVGAVIVYDREIVATGYNGAPAGEPHCTEAGCHIENGHCQRAIHAETNAVAQAAKRGKPVNGATLYCWDNLNRSSISCPACVQVMRAAGIVRVVGREGVSREF